MGSRNNKPARIIKGTALQPSLKSASGVWSLDEAMQAHRVNTWPQPNLFQPISNSLRFKNNVSYVIRQVVRQGNQRTFTTSLWVKRDSIGTRDALFNTCNISGIAYWGFEFGTDDSLYVYDNFSANLVTTQVFRDTSAWYHIVVAVDTTQATSSNRTKVYVNGAQVTSFSSAGYPAQGLATRMNGIDVPNQAIGSWFPSVGAFQYGGYITEVNFVDGYQLHPTLFGKFDTNNTWVPVAYTGTYGTNGFYLPFNNATTSQTLGYDASLNGTTTYDADQDPYRGSVALHLTGNGPAGGNNNVFADSGPNNLAITRQGSVITQGSLSPFPMPANTPYNPAINGASAWFNNTPGENLLVAASNVNAIGSGVFTLECWAYVRSGKPSVTGNTEHTIISQGNNASNILWALRVAIDGASIGWGFTGSAVTVTTPIPLNSWVHFAVTRDASNSEKIFVNGALVNTRTNTTNYNSVSSYQIQIGSSYDTNYPAAYGVNSYSNTLWGYVSSTRLIIGSAVYTAAFTPTNQPFSTLTNNLLTFSEDFTNSGWGKDGGYSVIPNYAVAPDGTPSMTLVSRAAGSLSNWAALTWANFVGTGNNAGKTYTFSIWVQAVSGTVSGTLAISDASYNTSSLSFTATTTPQRYSMSYNGPSGTWNASSAYIGGGLNLNSVGTSVLVWGAQLEVASSATTYTPTPANFRTAPSLLLNFANSAVTDTTGANNITTVGSATITSASKYGSGALAFSGSTSNYFMTNPGSQFEPGSQDFTVEFWWYPISTGRQWFYHATTDYWFAIDYSSVSTNQKMGMWASSNGSSWNMINSDSGGNGICNTVVPQNQWNHIAYTRNNTTFRLFLNGKLDGVVSASGSIVDRSSQAKFIGTWAGAGSGAPAVNGSIDDFRFTKGIARYTSDFTSPARALPETGGKSFVTTNVNAGVVRSFTTTGTTSWTAPTDVTSVEVLVVAGGAGGGAYCGGGGGAGGLIYNNSYPVTPGQAYTVTVGGGGAGTGASASRGTNGSNSVFGNLIAIGGGGGASLTAQGGLAGGSGGGDSHTGQTPGAGTAGQGFAGGRAVTSAYDEAGGGGGGAGAVGIAAVGSASTSLTIAGIGGPGLAFGISGSSTFYAGGGAGGVMRGSVRQLGGAGGGGNGAGNGTNATSGTVNTGGGGGGGGRADLSLPASYSGGDGGSGIVLVRYTTTAVGNSSDATTDNLVDSPTQYGHDYGNGGEVVGNYATWNPLDTATSYLKNGNLSNTAGGANKNVRGTIAVSSGKWYWEFTIDQASPTNHHGIWSISETTTTYYVGQTAGSWGIYDSNGNKRNNGSFDAYGSAYTLNDIGMVALDMDNGKIWWGKNGTWFNSGAPAAGTNAAFTNVTGTVAPATLQYSATSYNFGQRAWAYAPPQGFSALTTKNLPRPEVGSAAAAPNQFFDTVLYTGTGSARSVTGFNFAPDLLWIKDRSGTAFHRLFDQVRGASNSPGIYSNSIAVEAADNLTFTSNGFSYTTDPYGNGMNVNGNLHVAWGWKAGGAAVTNTSGTITSQVSANTASGFSVVTFTGTGTQASVGHGLSAAPQLIITKARNQTNGWYTYTTVIDGSMDYFFLNTAAAKGDSGLAVPTSTVFYNDGWSASYNMVAYCFHSVAGYSKIGTYVGNGSADGPFIYTGFKPRFVMVKKTDSSDQDWYIWDSARSSSGGNNALDLKLYPNQTYAENGGAGGGENTSTNNIDAVSNGFKLRTGNAASNASSGVYIYMAFADKPFGNVNGVAR